MKDREPTETGRPFWQRLAWFAGLWAAGVLALATVGSAIRLWIES